MSEQEAFPVSAYYKDRKRIDLDLKIAIEDYRSKLHTPELISNTWRLIWRAWGYKLNLLIKTPDCNISQTELTELENQGLMLVYIPPKLAAPEDVFLLNALFHLNNNPLMYKNLNYQNINNNGGWYDIEKSIDAPNANMNEAELIGLFIAKKRDPQRFNTYVIGSQASKLLTGNYFDEKTHSLIIGSRRLINISNANLSIVENISIPLSGHFYTEEPRLSTSGCNENQEDPTMGGRSEKARIIVK